VTVRQFIAQTSARMAVEAEGTGGKACRLRWRAVGVMKGVVVRRGIVGWWWSRGRNVVLCRFDRCEAQREVVSRRSFVRIDCSGGGGETFPDTRSVDECSIGSGDELT
jgi:hypothetical protein